MSTHSSASLSDLHRLIDRHYTLDEIRSLCLELGIDYEHLPGREKLGKIAELVQYCRRHSLLTTLLEKLREQWLHVSWPDSVIFPEQPRATYPAATIEPPLQRPARATFFTGREAELARLLDELQPGRIVTLTGPGGIGKSALAAGGRQQGKQKRGKGRGS